MRGVIREAAVSAWSQPVASLLTVVMVAGMCVATLLTTGRTAAAEAAALAQIDDAGTRTITVRAGEDSGVDSTVLERMKQLVDVEDVTAFGPIRDARNAAVAGARPVAVRPVYGDLDLPGHQFDPTQESGSGLSEPRAYVSGRAAETLGLIDGTGNIVTNDGSQLTVAGRLDVPEHLSSLEPLAVIPGDTATPQPVTLVVILVDEPHVVAPVTDVVPGLLNAEDLSAVSVETSESLAAVRAAVAGELGRHSRATVLGILAVAGLLVGVNLFGLVMMRRKDFGRRRALGASQGLIVSLLLTQVLLLAAIGAAAGTVGTLVTLAVTGSPLPTPGFSAAVAVSAALTAAIAALVPALIAARREPLYELRVP